MTGLRVLLFIGLSVWPASAFYTEKLIYLGKYEGICKAKGVMYQDEFHFVLCSDGVPEILTCAPGSRNSQPDHFRLGRHYGYLDFCDVTEHVVPTSEQDSNPEVETKEEVPELTFEFNGRFKGSCPKDGFFYKNDESFMVCSYGVPFLMHCAPGTYNLPYEAFEQNPEYGYDDLCTLVGPNEISEDQSKEGEADDVSLEEEAAKSRLETYDDYVNYMHLYRKHF